MTQKQIDEAAKAHAKSVIGEDQYYENKPAAKAIRNDFKAGVSWYRLHSKLIRQMEDEADGKLATERLLDRNKRFTMEEVKRELGL